MSAGAEALKLLKELIDGTTDVRQGAIYAEELDLDVWMDKAKRLIGMGQIEEQKELEWVAKNQMPKTIEQQLSDRLDYLEHQNERLKRRMSLRSLFG